MNISFWLWFNRLFKIAPSNFVSTPNSGYALLGTLLVLCLCAPSAYATDNYYLNTQQGASYACVADATIRNSAPGWDGYTCSGPVGGNSPSNAYQEWFYCPGSFCGADVIVALFYYPTTPCPSGQAFVAPGVCSGQDNGVINSAKNLGCSFGNAEVENGKKGNPCDAATGNKFQSETDLTGGFGFPMIQRNYNTGLVNPFSVAHHVTMGQGWSGTHLPHFETNGSLGSVTQLMMRRADGKGIPFYRVSGGWGTDADIGMSLIEGGEATLTLTLRDGTVERYRSDGAVANITDPAGRRTSFSGGGGINTSVTGPFGHQLILTPNSSARLTSITDPSGQVISYAYTSAGSGWNLTRVNYPDGTTKIYHYENTSFPYYLTGISYVDSAGVTTRYATYEYDSIGKAILTQHAVTDNGSPQEKFSLTYNSDTQTTVTDPVNMQEIMTFAATLGVKNLVNKVNQSDSKSVAQTFDANNLTCHKDEENRVTLYGYNSTNQRINMTEGLSGSSCSTCLSNPANCNAGGVGRVTTYEYLSPALDLPRFIRRPSVASGQTFETEIQYGDTGHPNLPTQIIQRGFTPSGASVSRTVGLGYNASGQVNSINGPRTDVNDVTTLEYYACTTGSACGQLKKITNALGHITTYDLYDATGRLKQMTDPNGLRTGYTYDARGRVKTITQTTPAGSAATTQYSYTPWGDVSQVIDPDGVVLNYQYDAAHDLRFIVDAAGNYIHYKYDLKGNRTGEDVYDSGGNLKRTLGYAYDLRNHLSQINNAGNITQLVSDAVGNLTKEIDPNNYPNSNPATQHTPDALNRLIQTIDRMGGITGYGYNINDRPTQVTPPGKSATQYTYDDLGNLLQEVSPDRGTTNYMYDAAGNIKALLTARNHSFTYTYDALNRLTFADAPETANDVTYLYDTCLHGIGRLCSVNNSFGTVTYGYDGLGNVTGHQSLGYTYTAAGRLRTLTYPSGAVVTYDYDAAGQVSQVNLTRNGTTQVIASGIQYTPFGPIKAMNYGNGKTLTQTWDSAYRVRLQTVPGVLQLDYAQYDPNGNLQQRLDAVASQWSNFAYDPLDRLDTASGGFGSRDYDYDGNGNRTRLTEDTIVSNYVYAPNTNRLTQAGTTPVTLDADGNITAQGARTYVYSSGFDYLTQVLDNGSQIAGYTYNALGQRVSKQANNTTTSYAYGLDGFLRVETPQSGTLREYIYLHDQPLAIMEPVAGGFLGVQPGYPQVNFNYNGTGTRYDAGTQAFQVDSQPIEFKFQISDDPYFIFGTLAIRLRLDDACHVAGGDAGPDLIVTGDVYDPNTFNLVLSGTLLTGEIVAAGAVSYTTNTAGFDFRFTATGGLLVTGGHWPAGQDIGVVLTSTNSNFSGSCTGNFAGNAQGFIGPIAPAANQAVALYYYHNDHRGTPQAVTDSAGNTVWKATYDPFGQATVTVNTITNNLRDAGMYFDSETGLHYNWHRYYDPKTGGYITVEPLGVVPGAASSPTVPREITEYFRSLPLNEVLLRGLNHPYRYAYNNPLTYIDPSGLDWFKPESHKYVVGRENSGLVEPGKGVGGFIDDYVPAGHTFGTLHDALVEIGLEIGLPDWMINIPTMPGMYFLAVGTELDNSLSKLLGMKPLLVCH
jgi:RHS repeat-associated protein